MISKEWMERQKKSYIKEFNGIYSDGRLKRILRRRDYFIYPRISPLFYEAIKEAIKYVIVNKDKYNMDSEDLNNCLKCYNVYKHIDADKDLNVMKCIDDYINYIDKLEIITNKIEFDFEGEHYSYELLKN